METIRSFVYNRGKMMMKKNILLLMLGLWVSFCQSCGNHDAETTKQALKSSDKNTTDSNAVKITFIELGSISCIPCKMMQPVMQAVETEYGGQVKVVFYDVWKDPAPGQTYRIRVIPTQVFLDESGREFFRHEGFFPKEEIDKLLTGRGLKKIIKTESTKS